ncbi:molybdopterin-dependent oxidoreductase [Thermocrinis minervae]|uniref:DMSO/TMAO reductase YedYZ, molybdopterin-dependent catalytic subunit n=1 Tax=Thermocrinis minervae TaxID=381751 RepID=A0A1M6RLS0_9AQUI|nr:molybdopterin-dependent oxidoreductase [Thermocrinis minervae]SHK33376.1 DMSO/TMAO reductase YedYZ, molybdopterin-dependent catalytic subunit [Thermocrinis minervae]
MDRRSFLRNSLVATAGGILLPKMALSAVDPRLLGGAEKELPSGVLEEQVLEALPGKKPLIKKTYRAPNYETPVTYFEEIFTPNEAFFVRYHLSNIPMVDEKTWRLRIGGDAVERPLELSLDDLKKNFEQVEIVALCQCSGNRRGLMKPHVPGVQWGYGAMGNAKWKGVRLKDILNKAGIKANALEVVLNGADGPVLNEPDFVKSIPIWKALDENVILAYEMNDQPLPHWNGFPVRVVVPGWTATYWIKHIVSIDVVSQPYKGFWMATAYRLPLGKFPMVERFTSQETAVNTPITEIVVNSLMLHPRDKQIFRRGQVIEVKGLAWDAGYGIKMVEVSIDGGKTWREAELGKDYGRFSWRQWKYTFKADKKGKYVIMAKATNRIGQTQTFELIWNPAGYHHNVVQRVEINVV